MPRSVAPSVTPSTSHLKRRTATRQRHQSGGGLGSSNGAAVAGSVGLKRVMDSPGIILHPHRKLDTATGPSVGYLKSFGGDGIAAPDHTRGACWRACV